MSEAEKQSSDATLEFEFENSFETYSNSLKELSEIQDTDQAYKLYYKVIGAIKSKYLKGPAYREVRNEINRFLKEGQSTGKDSRMAYISLLQKAGQILIEWSEKFKGQNVFDLYLRFEDLNKQWVNKNVS